VVKRVLEDFIAEREQDRIGIVMFAGSAMTVCPLTTDYAVLTRFLERVRTGILPDNTAIGEAVAFSVNRLKKAKGASRVMILLTDGANNAGTIQPLLGAELAAAKRIKVYTIGAGKKGRVPYPVNTVFGRQYDYVEIPIDETLLRRIAKKTGGKYFRATSTEGLREIYREIDKMEKTRVKIARSVEYREMFPFFLVPGILALLIEIVLTNTVFLRIP
jgi:Ca-activated chloride channel family protein